MDKETHVVELKEPEAIEPGSSSNVLATSPDQVLKPARNEKGQLLPGHTANPAGRPKSKPIKAALVRYLQDNPDMLEQMVRQAVTHAIVGTGSYFKEIRDMVDGKPATVIAGDAEQPLEILITDARRKLLAELEQAE